MEQVIIEVMKDPGRRADYKVFEKLVIRIGRGYDNDLILTDSYVSERHCVIRSQENGFVLEDSSSLNGTWLQSVDAQKKAFEARGIKQLFLKIFHGAPKHDEGKVKVVTGSPLHSGDHIIVGQTRLRFFVPGHRVEPTRPVVRPSAFFEEINKPWRAWGLVILAVLLAMAIEHQESYKNLSVSKFISVGIGLLLTILVWTGVWSFIGWLVRKKGFFHAHLSWVTMFFLGTTLVYPLADHVGYAASSPMAEMLTSSVIFWCSIAFLIAGHLMIATLIARRYQILWAVLCSLAVVSFGVVTYFAGKSEFNPQPDLYATLVPPYGRLGPSHSVDHFLKQSGQIFSVKSHDKQQ